MAREPAETVAEPSVVELEPVAAAEVLDPGEDLDGEDVPSPPLGEPFALAIGCDLLQQAPGVPGCWACLRCTCGTAFKVDLLSPGVKPCPGCRVPFSHALLLAPADDDSIVDEFLDTLEGADGEPG